MLLPDKSTALAARLRRAEEEVQYIAPCLDGAKRLLDIGCGAAITSVLLYEMLKLKHLFLMDGGPLRMREESWFEEAPAPWTDLQLTRDVAVVNGASFQIVSPDPDLTFEGCDAIMSLLSWGHHYPVRVYLPLARRSLPIGGKLIIDLRKGKGGAKALLAGGFRMAALLDGTDKLGRYFFEKVE